LPVQCKVCQREIVGDNYRLVAKWPFCLECFDGLGAKPPEGDEVQRAHTPGPAHAEAAELPRPVPPPRPSRPAHCVSCARPLSPNEEAPFGICVQCRTGLIAEPFKKILEQDAKEAAEREKAREAAEETADTPMPLDIVPPGVLGKKTCAQCGRRLLEPGGYHVIDGQWFCPACAHEARTKAKPQDVRHPASAGTAPASVRAASLPAAVLAPPVVLVHCDACERPTLSNELDRVEGFSLCKPCVSVDSDGALSVARARHRAKLKKLKDEFLG